MGAGIATAAESRGGGVGEKRGGGRGCGCSELSLEKPVGEEGGVFCPPLSERWAETAASLDFLEVGSQAVLGGAK